MEPPVAAPSAAAQGWQPWQPWSGATRAVPRSPVAPPLPAAPLDLPLETPAGIGPSREFLEASADLVARYGGSLSGEHGDGRARSELLDRMYSPEVLDLFGKVKAIFDPSGHLNPGVLVP